MGKIVHNGEKIGQAGLRLENVDSRDFEAENNCLERKNASQGVKNSVKVIELDHIVPQDEKPVITRFGRRLKRKVLEDECFSSWEFLLRRRKRKKISSPLVKADKPSHDGEGSNYVDELQIDDSTPLIQSIRKRPSKIFDVSCKRVSKVKSASISSLLQSGENLEEVEESKPHHNFKALDDLCGTKSESSHKRKKGESLKTAFCPTFRSGKVEEKSKSALRGSIGSSCLRWSNHKVRRNISKASVSETSVREAPNDGVNGIYDEQNTLEQDAARTLSSRFSSHCSFLGLDISFPTFSKHSADDGSASLPSKSVLKESASSPSGNGRKRQTKRYKEISYSQTDPFHLIDRRIKVYWPLDDRWYYGWVKSYDPKNCLHNICYDDREEEWLSLEKEKFKLQFIPSKIRGRPRASQRFSHEDIDERFITAKQRGLQFPGPKYSTGSAGVPKVLHSNRNRNDPRKRSRDGSSRPLKGSRLEFMHGLSSSGMICDTKNGNAEQTIQIGFHEKLIRNVYVRRRYHKKGRSSGYESTQKSLLESPQGQSEVAVMNEENCELSNGQNDKGKNLIMAERSKSLKSSNPRNVFDLSSSEHSAHGDLHISYCRCSWVKGQDLSLIEHQPLGGFLFIAYMRLYNFLLISGFLIRQFVFSKDLHVHCLMLYVWRTITSLHAVFEHNGLSCRNSLTVRQCRTVMCVWPDVLLNIQSTDGIHFSTVLYMECCLLKVVNSLIRTIIACMGLSGKFVPCISLGSSRLNDVQTPSPCIGFQVSVSKGFTKSYGFVLYDLPADKRKNWVGFEKNMQTMLNDSLSSSGIISACSRRQLTSVLYASRRQTGKNNFGGPSTLMSFQRPREAAALDISVSQKMVQKLGFPLLKELSDSPLAHDNNRFRVQGDLAVRLQNSQFSRTLKLMVNVAPKFFLELQYTRSFAKQMEPSYLEQTNAENGGRKEDFDVVQCRTGLLDSSGLNDDKDSDDIRKTNAVASETLSIVPHEDYNIRKVDVDADTISTVDGWVMSPARSSNSELNVNGAGAGPVSSQEFSGSFLPFGSILRFRRSATGRQSWRFYKWTDSALFKSLDSSNGTCKEVSKFYADMYFPGSMAYRRGIGNETDDFDEAFNSDSLPSQTHLWQNNRVHNFGDGFIEPRKRKLGSKGLFFCEHSFFASFHQKSHSRRGRPSRYVREEKHKRSFQYSSNFKLHSHSCPCIVNLLVPDTHRDWREEGAEVVIERSDQGDWVLAIRVSGITRFTYKPQQANAQSISIHRVHHTMLWKAGDEWSLEFPDRKQWSIFKDLHAECHNRNIRAAAIRHIPIPGVHEIEDFDNGPDSHFSRPASRYIRQVENEVEMALATSRITYDMDSEDEEWLGQLNSSTFDDGEGVATEVSEETFERIMDLLEKAAFTQQRELLNSDEVADFCWDIAPVEVVKAIHAHWQEKRWRKGMPLVRHFQPACWERYQQQLKEWESQIQELQNSPNSNKQVSVPEKPPLFAFCLKPRGLEVPNKFQKQKSHRKFSVSHLSSRDQEFSFSPGKTKKKPIYTCIAEDGSSEAAGRNRSSSPPQVEINPQVLKGNMRCSESLSQPDSTESKFKIHNSWKNREKMSPGHRWAKKLRLYAPSGTVSAGVAVSEHDQRRKRSIHECDANGDQLNDPSYALPSFASGMNCRYTPVVSTTESDLSTQEAVNASKTATEIAASKRAKAQRLIRKADMSVFRAHVAVMFAEGIQACETNYPKGTAFSENSKDAPFNVYKQTRVTGHPRQFPNGSSAKHASDILGTTFPSCLGHQQSSGNGHFGSNDIRGVFQNLHRGAASVFRANHYFKKMQSDAVLNP